MNWSTKEPPSVLALLKLKSTLCLRQTRVLKALIRVRSIKRDVTRRSSRCSQRLKRLMTKATRRQLSNLRIARLEAQTCQRRQSEKDNRSNRNHTGAVGLSIRSR